MPSLEVTMPRATLEIREKLALRLTRAVSESAGFEPEIFGIRFLEYDEGVAACGGMLWNAGSKDAPYLHFLLYCPRLSRAQKQSLATALSAAFVSVLKKPDWLPVIHICEHPYDNIVVGGKLLSDAYDECAQKRFYYDMGAV
ncbi:MAG: tautomerase family protein [Micavibrio aeruginosavorus]|uniref:Tautomerase family protein n=1 Tax=Micavibrio aeruginosavorus TaxID=349221 RepID=A0A7T5R119_9BACT|nr:MAG: tautomerase family protein [Micavibrio aeruginosavorus]